MKEFQKEIERFSKRVINTSKENLRQQNKRVTSSLYNSIKSQSKFSKNSFDLSFSLGGYGEFVDKGVKGANPNGSPRWRQKAPNSPFKFKTSKSSINTSGLDRWMKIKGIKPRNIKGKKPISQKSLRYLIGRSIHGQGIKPSLFFTKAFEKEYKNLSGELINKFGLMAVDEFMNFTLSNK
jgi:hypothetical protein